MAQMNCPNCGKYFEEFQFKDHSCGDVHCPGCGGHTAHCYKPQFKIDLGQEEVATSGERIGYMILSLIFLGIPLLSLTTRTIIFEGRVKRQHVFPEYFENDCTPCGFKWKWVSGIPKPQVNPQPELVEKRETYEKQRKWETTKIAIAYSGTGVLRKVIGDQNNAGFVSFQAPDFYALGEVSQRTGDYGTIYSDFRWFGKSIGHVKDGIVYSTSSGVARAVGEIGKDGTIYLGTGSLRKAVGEVEPPNTQLGGAALLLCLIPMIEKHRQGEYESEQYEQGRAHQMAEDAARRAGWR